MAEELTQEALLRIWQHADRFDPTRSSLSTWIFRIARNLYIDRLRREHSPGGNASVWPVHPAEGMDDPYFTAAESYVAHVDLKERIDRLPALQARLIRMSYLEAKSHRQIAEEVGMPLGTVKSLIRRAFLRLQTTVQEPA